ncbi:MAG: CRISPR-associated endonuclease Cas2 [Candidatus Kerfeldbacteria bacterium]|nr:CRISPR-associated endonuclease Cas2 [Candidatus Kerfeldbacteria bacterium]
MIAYDITDDRIRNRLVKILEWFGERVQYSLFECELTEAGEMELRARLKAGSFLNGDKGAVFIYPLERGSVSKIERYGKATFIDNTAVIVT